MYQENTIDNLLAKLAAGTLTNEELAILIDWYNSLDDTQTVLPAAHQNTEAQLKARMYRQLMAKVRTKPKRSVLIRMMPYAAAILVVVLGVGYFWTGWPEKAAPVDPQAVQDIPPGRNRATLTLTDGRVIDLSEEQEGIIVGKGITTYADGSNVVDQAGLMVEGSIPERSQSATTYQLSTPRGGTYQITLPDGTRVWLNAGSLLTYPSRFEGERRIVELTGEAYFDVREQVSSSTGALWPFVVLSDGQQIEVLGTEFNVSAYPDDAETKTTLVTGRVRVGSNEGAILLQPGEQAQVSIGGLGLRVDPVDTELFVAWKSGKFHFRKTPLADVLKQVSRWYDVEVAYNGEIPEETFSGKIRRDVSLMGVLDILRLSAINVELKDRILIINQ
ncbi:FecR family protein [Parapedobacter soli]|uniref:FecR family protein n=1 Tax=Parapedobacter soli TaxID=416955 RepID=UPI0021C7BE06|nr:FecR family protein [Parapedobacter soli]